MHRAAKLDMDLLDVLLLQLSEVEENFAFDIAACTVYPRRDREIERLARW